MRETEGVVAYTSGSGPHGSPTWVHLLDGRKVGFDLTPERHRLRDVEHGASMRFLVLKETDDSSRLWGREARAGDTVLVSLDGYARAVKRNKRIMPLMAGFMLAVWVFTALLPRMGIYVGCLSKKTCSQPPDGSDSGETGEGDASGNE